MKKKVLLSSILTIALCLSLIAGSTYALFTSQDSVNIAVTAGKVAMEASIANVKLWSVKGDPAGTDAIDENGNTYTYEDQTANNMFLNTGTAKFDAGELTIDRITPGDKVEFEITGTNGSDVTILVRYTIKVSSDEGIAKGMILKVGTTEYEGVTSYTSAWETVTVDGDMTNAKVELGLPVYAGNEYQEKEVKYIVTVEAVQGNAVVDTNAPVVVYSAENLDALLADTTVTEVSVDNTVATGNEGLDGNNKTITVVNKADDKSNHGVTTTGGTIKNVTVTGDSYEFEGKTYGFRAVYITEMTEDVVIENATLEGTYALNINSSTAAYALTVNNSTLNGWVSYGSASGATFTDCTFGMGDGYANIRPYVDTTFTNCEFKDGYTITCNSTTDNFNIVLTNCTVEGVLVTADNFATLFNVGTSANDLCNSAITVTVDGTVVAWN